MLSLAWKATVLGTWLYEEAGCYPGLGFFLVKAAPDRFAAAALTSSIGAADGVAGAAACFLILLLVLLWTTGIISPRSFFPSCASS